MQDLNLSLQDFNWEKELKRYLIESEKKNLKEAHTKMLNKVNDYIYSIENLSIKEKFIFMFVYDFKAQQKYTPWLIINNQFISDNLWISKSEISKIIKSLSDKNLLWYKYVLDKKLLVPNEDIKSWDINLDKNRLISLENERTNMMRRNLDFRELHIEYSWKKDNEISKSKKSSNKLKNTL